MLFFALHLLIAASGIAGMPNAVDPPAAQRIADFELPDFRGATRKLSDWQDTTAVVIVFLGVECPLNRLYAARLVELAREFGPRGAVFVGIDANASDSISAIAGFARAHHISFPILKDAGHAVADRFGARRTPEVFLLDRKRTVRYRGRIDDQYSVGLKRAKPTRPDLALALEEVLTGRPVSQPVTEVSGCWIDRLYPSTSRGPVTYTKQIAGLLQRHCLVCHRPGQVAPFSLTTYRKAAAWAETIREVVDKGQMPPWHANRKYGRFANDPGLTEEEKRLIDDWVNAGCPEGDPADMPPPVTFADGWQIPEPDLIVSIPAPFTVPAEGVLEYQRFVVDPGFQEDKWIRAVQIRPENGAVVHHALVQLQPPGSSESALLGTLGSVILATTTRGTPPLILPDGMAKLVPAGWKFVFIIHYTPIGTVQTDQTSMGLVLADPKSVKKEVATRLIVDPDLNIPPHTADHRVERTDQFSDDVLLLAMFPHMHFRGKSFRYEAVYPDGSTEILLDVPRYDFNWQNRYELAAPKRLPAGTTLRCIAHYDNSADNPQNPDPNATVHTGQQSWDEMFNGCFEVTLADQDLTRKPVWNEVLLSTVRRILEQRIVLILMSGGLAFLLLNRFRKSVNRRANPPVSKRNSSGT